MHLPSTCTALAAMLTLVACGKGDGDTAGEDSAAADRPIAGALSLSEADLTVLPELPASDLEEEGWVTKLGISLSAGDLNGDGKADLVVGADGGYGTVYVFSGPLAAGSITVAQADAVLSGVEDGDGDVSTDFALSARAAGDINGDGYGDLLMTDTEYAGGQNTAYLLHGPFSGASAIDARVDVTLYVSEEPYAGVSIASVGDVNADGIVDLLVGSDKEPFNDEDSGGAWLIYGPVDASGAVGDLFDARIYGASSYDHAGAVVAGAGDVNGDGMDDLLIGAPTASSGSHDAGAAYLLLAPVVDRLDLDDAHVKFVGHIDEDDAGAAVANAGDVDGDGLPDILIGAPGMEDSAPRSGGGYLVLDYDDTNRYVDDLIAFPGAAQGDGAGEAVSSAGDVDGDGFADLLIGAPRVSTHGEDTGAAFLIYGGPDIAGRSLADADAILTGDAEGDDAGSALAGLGDLSGDGLDDFAVGAYHEASVMTYGGAAFLFFGQ